MHLNPPALAGNIPRLYALAFLKMTLFPMAIITLFWKDQIGLSLTEIMVLQGIFSLATLLLEYPSGYLADRLGYRFSLSLAALLGTVGWGLYLLAGSFAGVALAEVLLGFSFAFVSGADSALLFESLRQGGREQDYARYDGRMNGMAQAGEAMGALFAGGMYAASPLLPFALQVVVWLLALSLTRRLEEAPPGAAQPPVSHLREAARIARQALVSSRPLRYGILFSTVLGIASFYPVWLIQPYMQENGVPLSWFGPVWAGANLTVALFSVASQRLRFHLGDRAMAALFLLLIAAGYLGLGLWTGVWGFLCYYLLTAMRGLQGPVLRHHLQRLSTRDNRASILSLKSFIFRLLFVASGPVVGLLADGAGLRPTFLLLAVLFTLALLPLAHKFLSILPETSPT